MENFLLPMEKNHRVQFLNPDLTFSRCFGKEGSLPGELLEPRGIAIDSVGMVYVADWHNYRVQKFTPEGEVKRCHILKIGIVNLMIQLVCVDILYVAEWYNNSCVCMFTTSGEFLGYVGGGSQFKYPTFITSDQFGRVMTME